VKILLPFLTKEEFSLYISTKTTYCNKLTTDRNMKIFLLLGQKLKILAKMPFSHKFFLEKLFFMKNTESMLTDEYILFLVLLFFGGTGD
jgi:hypothetical protein